MTPAQLAQLLLIAAIWGGSYVLMRVIAPVYGGFGTMWLRIALAGSALTLFASVRHEELQWRKYWKVYLFTGMLGSALPFGFIAFAMKTLPAGYGAILNATTPFFAALFSALMLHERLSRSRLLGLAIGFIGVALIVNLGPIALSAPTLLAIGSCLAATTCYGFVIVYLKKNVKDAPSMGIAAGGLLLPAIVLAPLGVAVVPATIPATEVIVSLIILALVCSALAHTLYYQLNRTIGPTKTASVTFLIPLFGITWGALLFGERMNTGAVIGGVIVLIGVSLVIGLFPKRSAAR